MPECVWPPIRVFGDEKGPEGAKASDCVYAAAAERLPTAPRSGYRRRPRRGGPRRGPPKKAVRRTKDPKGHVKYSSFPVFDEIKYNSKISSVGGLN